MRILVVDDHDDNRESLANVLVGLGHEVDTAVNSRQAVDKAGADGRTRPELMVLDMVLPSLGGASVLANLSGSGLPVVVWTGAPAGDEAALPGVVAVVEKPNVEALLAVVARIAAGEQPKERP